MKIKDFLPKKKEVFVWVKETEKGVETYVSPSLSALQKPIKAQLRAFFEEILKEVK